MSQTDVKALIVNDERAAALKEIARSLPNHVLTDHQLFDLEMLASGAMSPLTGFLAKADYESVLEDMRLADGALWPLPICLDVSDKAAAGLEPGKSLALRDQEGVLLAVMHITDIWPVDREREAARVYGTSDPCHPGVARLFRDIKPFYVGGPVEVVTPPRHFDHQELRLTPADVRQVMANRGWQRLVAFISRNPMHRAHFEIALRAMRLASANLMVMPVAGLTKPGDFDPYTRIRCVRAVCKHFPPGSFLISLLPAAMRLAGPREAVWQAMIAASYGATHIVAGSDHGGPGCRPDGEPHYPESAARELLMSLAGEIGIEVLPFGEMVYLPFEDEFRPREEAPAGAQVVSVTGSDIRDRFRNGKRLPNWVTFPEVIREIRRSYPSPRKQGFTVFLTGLSGAGKSTIAGVLQARFLEIGDRPVTLLDGDIVRTHLSSELGFSKEHRDINIRRIGFVASEITKNRGIAICAPIAPYANTRASVREMIQQYGGFIEVHVATPIEVCEQRDRKGMYAKARAGLIKGFTGIDDPYEAPEAPEVRLDTSGMTPEEAAHEVMLFLGEKGFI